MELMQMIKGITFAPFPRRGKLDTKAARASLRNLKKLTGANLIILVPNGLQEAPQSETIARETQPWSFSSLKAHCQLHERNLAGPHQLFRQGCSL